MAQQPERAIEANVEAKFKVQVTHRTEQRKQVFPGRLLEVTVDVPEIAADLPAYVELDAGERARLTAERVTFAAGFFRGPTGAIVVTDGSDPSVTRFFSGGLLGSPPARGQQLSPRGAFAKLAAAVSGGRFTAGEVETFAGDPAVLEVLRQGAVEHVSYTVGMAAGGEAKALSAIARSHVVPGFGSATLQGGRGALLDYLRVLLKTAGVRELLDVVAAIMKEVAS